MAQISASYISPSSEELLVQKVKLSTKVFSQKLKLALTSWSDVSLLVNPVFFRLSERCRGRTATLAPPPSWSSSLDRMSTTPTCAEAPPIHFRGEPMGVPPSDLAFSCETEREGERERVYIDRHFYLQK